MIVAVWICAATLIIVIVLLLDIHRAIGATCRVLLDTQDQNRQILIELQQIRGVTQTIRDSTQ